LEDALKGCIPYESLKRYRTRRNDFNRSFDEYRAAIIINQSIEAKEFASMSGINQNAHVDTELRRRELQLRAEWSRALIELAEEAEHPLCLFIDGYERFAETVPELIGWLWEEVLLKLAKKAPHPILIVTSGWETPSNAAVKPFAVTSELGDFDQAQLRSYLQKQGVITVDLSSPEQEELVTAFYELTKGHPLVLSLAITYFIALEPHERNAYTLRMDRPLVDEQARIEFLEERLLSRLQEPYRTLLEYGPILRYFDQATLQVLLSGADTGSGVRRLDDRAYAHFLRYPFIRQLRMEDNEALQTQLAFHELVRRVGLSALRRHHPKTRELLHRRIAVQFENISGVGQKQEMGDMNDASNLDVNSISNYTQLLTELPERKFKARLEYLYHALQVEETQLAAFNEWRNLTLWAVDRWRRQQAGLLLEIVRQLSEEGEPFLSETSNYYGQYLILFSRFLTQELRWDKARGFLEEATKIFEQIGNFNDLGTTLNYIGSICQTRGDLEQALGYYERVLALRELMGDTVGIARSLNNIGGILRRKGNLEEALRCYKRALDLSEQGGDTSSFATSLNNVGFIYDVQGKLAEALHYYERALALFKQVGSPTSIVTSLNNIGSIYNSQNELTKALSYYQSALALSEQLGNQALIVVCLNNIGLVYRRQGDSDSALRYYERSLTLSEQMGNPPDTAIILNNIGDIYEEKKNSELAMSYYERALTLSQSVGDLANIALLLNSIGLSYRNQGDLRKALSFYEQALVLSESLGNPAQLVTVLTNIASIYYSQKKWKEVLSYCERALPYCRQTSNLAQLADTLAIIGLIYYNQGKWKQVVKYYTEALELYESLGKGFEPQVVDRLEGLSICYAQLGDYNKGRVYFERAQQIRRNIQKIK
jgi:tetratricopeptide (TPR) repeat protein